MPAGALLREGVDTFLVGARLDSAGESGSVPTHLSTGRFDDGFILRFVGNMHRWGRGCSVGVSSRDADRDRTGAPAARLTLGVELGLRVGLSLRLLQASALSERCADVASPLLANSPSGVSQRLLLLRRERRFVDGHLRGPIRLLILWRSRNRMLNHGRNEYRRVHTQTHATRQRGMRGGTPSRRGDPPGIAQRLSSWSDSYRRELTAGVRPAISNGEHAAVRRIDGQGRQSSNRDLSVKVRHFARYSSRSMMPPMWRSSNALRSWLISRRRTSATDRTSGE